MLFRSPKNESAPLRFASTSPALRVLQQIRDEAHRFALTYHRTLSTQKIKESMLDDIPGIGATRKAKLLTHFGSVARLRRATVDDIAAAPDIGPKLAALIHSVFHS